MNKRPTSITIELTPTLLQTLQHSCRVMVRDQERQIPFLLEVALGLRQENDWVYQHWLKGMQAGRPLVSPNEAFKAEKKDVLEDLMANDLPSIIAKEITKISKRERPSQGHLSTRRNRTKQAQISKRKKTVAVS